MIHGIGTDIIEVKRIAKAIERFGQRFLDRLFTEYEQESCKRYCDAARHFAGRFAAKEACVKALGTGFSQGTGWLNIEIRNDLHGKPYVYLTENLLKEFDSPTLLVSISHCREYATASAIFIIQKDSAN